MEDKNTNPAAGEEQESLQEVSNTEETAKKETVETELSNPANEEASDIKATKEATAQEEPQEVDEKAETSYEPEDFSDLKAEELVERLKSFVEKPDWFKFNKSIQALQTQYEKIFQEDLEKAKKEFLSTGESEINFFFKPLHKKEFDQTTYQFRTQKRKHYKEIETAQKANLERKKNIIEEIKELLTADEDINSIYKKFKELQDSWYNTGSVPRIENQNIWQTFRHHVERFYDFLHLNRELRELDFKHNYEAKLKLIERAEELATQPDIIRASRELNTLHQMWKNDLGPVMREHREELWKRFQEATKTIQKKRQEHQKDLVGVMQKNLERKNDILTQMKGFISAPPTQHRDWQSALKKFQELREEFKAVGYVAGKSNKKVWQEFRDIGKDFMKAKNDFYKLQKKEQKENVKAKNDLIARLNAILESEDWENRVDEVKGMQQKWKNIGFVPRKIDNKMWGLFKEKNTLYFDRLRSGYQKLNAQDETLVAKREAFIEKAKKRKINADAEAISKELTAIWDEWDALEPLKPNLAQKMDQALAKALIEKIKGQDIAPAQKKQLEYDCTLLSLKQNSQGLNEAIKEIRSEIKNHQTEIIQLENNLDFFSRSSTDNPLFKEAQKKIEKIKKGLEQHQEKLIHLKQLQNSLAKKQLEEEQETNESEQDEEASSEK